MTMFFSIVLLFMTCLKVGSFYYFNKLLGFVAVAFFSVFLEETLVAPLRILCENNAFACWPHCFCSKFKIVNSWLNSNLVILDKSWEK